MWDFLKYNAIATLIIGVGFCFDTVIVEGLTKEYVYADPSGPLFAGTFIVGGGWMVIWASGFAPLAVKSSIPNMTRRGWILTSVAIVLALVLVLWQLGLSPRNVDPSELYVSLSIARIAAATLGLLVAWWVVAPRFLSEDNNKLFRTASLPEN